MSKFMSTICGVVKIRNIKLWYAIIVEIFAQFPPHSLFTIDKHVIFALSNEFTVAYLLLKECSSHFGQF